jgi:hypothetical protein
VALVEESTGRHDGSAGWRTPLASGMQPAVPSGSTATAKSLSPETDVPDLSKT